MNPSSNASWRRLVSSVKAEVERDGLAIVSGFDADLRALYSYTVGLSADDHPELLIVGLRPRLAAPALRTAASHAHVTYDGLRNGSTLRGILAGVPLRAVDVVDTGRLLPVANALFAEPGIPVSAFQLVYPDTSGRMPWEHGADQGVPLLGFEPPSHEHGEMEPEHTDGYGYGW